MIYEIVLIVLCVLVLKLDIALFLCLVLPKKKKQPTPEIVEEAEDYLLGFRNLFSNNTVGGEL